MQFLGNCNCARMLTYFSNSDIIWLIAIGRCHCHSIICTEEEGAVVIFCKTSFKQNIVCHIWSQGLSAEVTKSEVRASQGPPDRTWIQFESEAKSEVKYLGLLCDFVDKRECKKGK